MNSNEIFSNLNKIDEFLYEIPQTFKKEMRVSAYIFASQKMLKNIQSDRSLSQLVNTATLPGIVKNVLAMPDIHEGYGFPIGAVAATRADDGVISPGGVGYDINCGVRSLISDFQYEDLKNHLEKIAHQMFRDIPSGLGRGSCTKLSISEMNDVLSLGTRKMIEWGFGLPEDLEAIESLGSLKQADDNAVSNKAKQRGQDQLGSLGSGNHFLEMQVIDEVYNKDIADEWNLKKGQIAIMIHTGSRGLGHQNCIDYVKRMVNKLNKWGISLPDKELACAPLKSEEGAAYLAAMSACANFAWANRQMITYKIRKSWDAILGGDKNQLRLLYDVSHNIAKIEEHKIGKHNIKLCVHRKGSTRAFGKNHPELNFTYRKTGQPVIIPGTMGTSSYLLAGSQLAMEKSFGSVCHGAGRLMSRRAAKNMQDGSSLRKELKQKGIIVCCHSNKGLAEEAPNAYKNVDEVVQVVSQTGLANKVARLKPIAVIKG